SRMCQRIRYRPLEELFRGSAERLRGSQVFVKALQCPEEPLHLLGPWQWLGIVPLLLSAGDRESPVKEVAHVGQDLSRRSSLFSAAEGGKARGRVANGLAGAVGQGSQGMP